MSGLRYPKLPRRKKRKVHKHSILHQKDGTCYLCMLLDKDYQIHTYTEEHHIFGGPNRKISEAEGLKVYLCADCHRGPAGVHQNAKKMRLLQQEAQRAYEKTHTRSQFVRLIGRNYLGGDYEPTTAASDDAPAGSRAEILKGDRKTAGEDR